MRRSKHGGRNPSLDHLIGGYQKVLRHGERKRLRGLEVDHELELDWCLNGKLARFRTAQHAINIGRRKPKLIALLISVAQQAAEFSEKTEWIDGRQTVAISQSVVRGCRR